MKKDDVKNVISDSVKMAWDELDVFSKVYGANHDLTNRQRTVWCTLDDLWNKLYPDEKY